MVKLAKKMKKNNIAVDFVNFGEEEENTSKLEAFITNINSADNSHIVTVPAGPNLLSDTLLSTPIFGHGQDGGAYGGDMGGGFDAFGIDANDDPELALALRMSMEEENQRQAREEEKRKAEQAAKEAAENLGTVKEEDENTPLLGDANKGEGSSSGANKKKDDDAMDTN